MKNYTLPDLAKDMKAHTQAYDAAYEWYRLSGAMNHARNDAEARRWFDTRVNQSNYRILNGYVPVYSRERNHKNWGNSKKKAAAIGIGGIAALVSSFFVDSHVSRVILEGAGVAGIIGSPVALGISYLNYKL